MKNDNFRPPESFLPGTERTLILVDWSNLMYRAWFVSKEEPWVAFCKFFDMLRLCIRKSKQAGVPVEVIFAGESPTKLRRTQVMEEHLFEQFGDFGVEGMYGYKGTRKPNKNPEFAKFRKDLGYCLDKLGYKTLCAQGAEADDVIATIVAKTCHRCFCKKPCANCDCALKYKTDVVIFSGDRDLQQLLAWDRVLIYRAPGLFVSKADFEAEYGIPVTKYGVYKALVGDKSDNIAGVDGIGPVKAKIAINAGTVAEDIWELGGDKAANEFRLALEMVNLDTKLELKMDDLYSGAPKFDEQALLEDLDPRVVLEIKRLKDEFQ